MTGMPPKLDRIDAVAFALAAAIAAASAASMLAQHWAAPEDLWRNLFHDRSGHYSFGVNLTLALRDLDLYSFFNSLEKAKVWPPVHGLLLSAVLLPGGPDFRLGIVPSLFGWALTATLAFAIARRLVPERIAGYFAGAVAFAFTVTSPAFMWLGRDVMLEALGAGLSAAVLFAYVRACERPERLGRWRALAILLTLLFFEKGNYWLLALAAIAAAALFEAPRWWIGQIKAATEAVAWRVLFRHIARDPFFLIAGAIALYALVVGIAGPFGVELFGRMVPLRVTPNLITALYAFAFVGAARAWWPRRAVFDRALADLFAPEVAVLFRWHILPLAVSFLLPQRLAVLVWHLGPSNAMNPTFDPWGGISLYWTTFAQGFHVSHWAALLASGLFLLGLARIKSLPSGGIVVFAFVFLSLIASLMHPNKQPRYVTTWLFAVWVGAGVGAAALLQAVVAERFARARGAVAGLVLLALTVALGTTRPSPQAHQYAHRLISGPSDFAFARAYLPYVESGKPIVIAPTMTFSEFFAWAARERCRCQLRVDRLSLPHQPTREQVQRAMAELLMRTSAETVVIIDAPAYHGENEVLGWSYPVMRGILDAMVEQDRFVRAAEVAVPEQNATVTIWRRRFLADAS